jgi:hypothetical protein
MGNPSLRRTAWALRGEEPASGFFEEREAAVPGPSWGGARTVAAPEEETGNVQ